MHSIDEIDYIFGNMFFSQHFDEKDSAIRNDNATIQIQTLAVHRLNYFYFFFQIINVSAKQLGFFNNRL